MADEIKKNEGGAVVEDKMTWRHIGLALTACTMSFVAVALMFNTSGLFFVSISEDLGVGLGQVSLYISVSYIVAMFILPFCQSLMDRFNARWVYCVVEVLMIIAYVIMANAQDVWVFYLAGVLMAGTNSFNMYMMPVLVSRWLKKNVGTVVGIAGACTGLGGTVWNLVFAGVVTGVGWRTGFLYIAALMAVLLVLVFIFVRSDPEEVGIKPYGFSTIDSNADTSKTTRLIGANVADVRKSAAFWLLLVMTLCGGLCALMSQYLTSFAMSVGYELFVGASMTSACFFATLIAKIFLGWLADRNLTLAVSGAIFIPALGFIGLMAVGGGNETLIIFMAFLYGWVQPSNTLITPLICQKLFGEREYGKIWGAISTVAALACAISITIWGWIYDATGTYYGVFTAGVVLLLIRFAFYLVGKKNAERIPWYDEDGNEVERVAVK